MAIKGRDVVLGILAISFGLMVFDMKYTDKDPFPKVLDNISYGSQGSLDSNAPHYERSGSLIRDMGKLKSVRLTNPMGTVTATQGDGDVLQCLYTIRVYSKDEEAAKKYARNIKVFSQRVGDTMLIRRTAGERRRGISGVAMDYKLILPKGVSPDIRNRYGTVDVRVIDADTKVSNSFGKTIIGTINGNADIASKYSDTDIGSIKGMLHVDFSFGSLSINGVGDNAEIKSNYGQVIASDIHGALKANLSFGGLNAHGIDGSLDVDGRYSPINAVGVGGKVDVKSSFGAVDVKGIREATHVDSKFGTVSLGLASGIGGFKVDAEVERGRFSPASSAIEPFIQESKGENGNRLNVKGSFGKGSKPVIVKSKNGDVSLNME